MAALALDGWAGNVWMPRTPYDRRIGRLEAPYVGCRIWAWKGFKRRQGLGKQGYALDSSKHNML